MLFCNVLGQLRHLLGVEDTESSAFVAVRSAVQSAIVGRPGRAFMIVSPTSRRASRTRWLPRIAGVTPSPGAGYYGSEPLAATLQDHGTEAFPPELPHVYLRWEPSPAPFT